MSGKSPAAAKGSGSATNKSFSNKPAPDTKSGTSSKPCDKTKTHWFAIRVEDVKGNLVRDVKVKLKLSDGSERNVDLSGEQLSLQGVYRVDGLPSGICEVSFPELPDAEWKPKS